MTFTEKAQQLLAAVLEAGDTEQQVGLITIALVRATGEACQLCETGHGDEYQRFRVRCAICRKEPEVIVCYDCARAHKLPSWGS